MTIQYTILGFLSWQPLTGYDLKKLISDSEFLHWSGNSNQIYTSLVQLHRDGLVCARTEQQPNLPPRKIYTLTDDGRRDLRNWAQSPPELPEVRNTFLAQLAWADQLTAPEIDTLVGAYEEEVGMRLAMCRERIHRGPRSPDRTPRERYLWEMANKNRLRAWKSELLWARTLRRGLGNYDDTGKRRRRK
jgi:DNA-binding PadR family transcriptional regulator